MEKHCENCGKKLTRVIYVEDSRTGKGGSYFIECRCNNEKEDD